MRLIIAIPAVMILCGCTGTAVVLKEDTQAVDELIDQSMEETRSFYGKLGRQRLDYLIGFMAARPSCAAESPLLILPAQSRCLTGTEKMRWRECGGDPAAHRDCKTLLTAQQVIVSPQLAQPRQTTLNLIGVIASYQQAMMNVLQDEEFDTKAELKNLQSRLGSQQKRIDKLRSDESSTQETRKELDKQIDAIGTLTDLIRDAHQQASDFAKLKTLILNNGPAIDQALERLLETYEKADKPFSDLLARQEIERARREYNSLGPERRAELTTEMREQRIRAIYEPELLRLALTAGPDALAVGLRGLIASHKALQEGFKGNLTSEQRKRIAKEAQHQLKAAFKAMLNVVKLFT